MTNPRMIDRRTFLAASAALGFSASLPSAARAAGPNRGGNFRIGVANSSTSDNLDPANINTRFQTYLQYQLRNYLVEVGPGGKLIPELAESWEGTNGGKTWIFKLRKGVTFHTGKSLTAEDVIFSFNYHTKPNSKSTGKPMLSSLSGIKAEGENTVIFDLTAANVNFPAVVSNYSFAIVPDGTTNFDQGDWHRRVYPGRIQAGHQLAGEAKPQLLETRSRALRQRRDARHKGLHGTHCSTPFRSHRCL